MAGPLHEKCVAIIAEGPFDIRGKIPESVSDRIYFLGNPDFNGFEHHYHGSEKTPNMALEVTDNDGDHQMKFVAEVGFSESYEELVEDARMWLEGLASRRCNACENSRASTVPLPDQSPLGSQICSARISRNRGNQRERPVFSVVQSVRLRSRTGWTTAHSPSFLGC